MCTRNDNHRPARALMLLTNLCYTKKSHFVHIIITVNVASGTGFILALTVARKGGDILMLNRESSRSANALKRINEYITEVKSDSKCYQIACDLQDFASVRAAAVKVTEQFPAGIDVLVNNAGVMFLPDKATKDGYGMTVFDAHPLLRAFCAEIA